MRLLGKILRWTAIVGAALVVVVVAGVWITIHTAAFRNFVRVHAEQYFAENFQGRLTIGNVQGSVLGSLQLSKVALSQRGSDVAKVGKLHIRFRLLPLLYSTLSIRSLDITGLQLNAIENKSQQWNLLEALSERHPSPPSSSSSSFRVLLRGVRVRESDLRVAFADGKVYRLSTAALDGRIRVLPKGIVADVSQLKGQLAASGFPKCAIDASLAYRDTSPPGYLVVRRLRLDTPGSKIELAGRISNLETLASNITLKAPELAGQDVAAFVPRWSKSAGLIGTIHITGDRRDMHAVVAMRSGKAQVSGDVHLDLAQSPFGYRGSIKLAEIDIPRLFSVSRFAGVLNGSVEMAGKGTAAASLSGQTSLEMTNLAVNQYHVGKFTLGAKFHKGSADFNLQMADGQGGTASSIGEVSFLGTPKYQFTLQVAKLKPARISPKGGLGKRDEINLSARIHGTGVALAAMDANANIDIQQSTLGRIRINRGTLRASISKGQLNIADASFYAGRTRASAQGSLLLAGAAHKGEFNYRLSTPNVAPWLELAGYKGRGSLNLNGSASGRLGDLGVRGTVSASSFHFRSYEVGHLKADFDLGGVGQAIPYGSVNADLTAIKAGVALKSARLGVNISKGPPSGIQLTLDAVDEQSRPQKLAADVRYDRGNVDGNVSTLTLDTPHGIWRLQQTASFHYDPRRISVNNLALVDGQKRVTLNGEINRGGVLDLVLAIQKFNIANATHFLPGHYPLAGVLSAQARIGGTAALPTITSSAELASAKIHGISLQGLSASFDYSSGVATLRMIALQDRTHELKADGRLPMILRWDGKFEARPTGSANLRIHSKELDLALLKYVNPRMAKDIKGKLAVDISLKGPLDHLEPSGGLWLWDAKADVRPLGMQLASMSATVTLGPQAIYVKSLYAQAGKGSLNVWGMTGLEDYKPKSFALTARFHDWPIIHTRRYQADIGGLITCGGTPDSPKVGGSLNILDATIRPKLAFLESTSLKRDKTITIIRPGESQEQNKSSAAAIEQTDIYKNLAINLEVRIHPQTWIKHANSYAQLEGQVQIQKHPGGPLMLVGSIQTVRGSIEVAGQALTLTQGVVYFTGGVPINPSLNVVARRDVASYTVYANIKGTATKPSLSLTSDPSLPQADVLSILMFGRPVTDLGQTQQNSLQEQALSIAGGYAASTVGKSVAQALGLGSIQIGVQAGQASVGKYITQNIYVSASQSINPGGPQTPGQAAQQAAIRYYITPHWDLETTTSRISSQINLNWHTQY